jgi:Flp pilus assembly protein protease CpaA
MGHASLIPAAVVLAATIVATVTDVRRFKIYNALTIPLLFTGFAFHAVAGGWDGLTGSVAGAGVGFATLFLPFLLGAMGAGDVKLIAAMGAWLGTEAILIIVLVGCVLTSLYAIALIFRRGGLTAVFGNILLNLHRLQTAGRSLVDEDEYETVPELAKRADHRQRLIPFSAMAAAGLGVALAWQVWQ